MWLWLHSVGVMTSQWPGHSFPDGPSGRYGGLPVHRLHEGAPAGHRAGELGLAAAPPRRRGGLTGRWGAGAGSARDLGVQGTVPSGPSRAGGQQAWPLVSLPGTPFWGQFPHLSHSV